MSIPDRGRRYRRLTPLFHEMNHSAYFKNRSERRRIIANSRRIIRYLSADLGERTLRCYDNLNKARDFIAQTFVSQGGSAAFEEFKVDGMKVSNVISEIRGTESPDRIILIGAHYDTIEGTPGADDNASAVAGLLELHRLLSASPHRRTIRFVAFTLEEPPFFSTDLMGSMQHARRARERNDRIELMICLEMLGFAKRKVKQKFPYDDMKRDYPRYGNYLAVVAFPSSAEFAYLWRNLHNGVSSRRIYEMIGPSSIPGIGFSDHMSFNRYNYRNVMLTDTAFFRNGNYHTEHDTYDTINFRFLAENIRASHLVIKEIASMQSLPYSR